MKPLDSLGKSKHLTELIMSYLGINRLSLIHLYRVIYSCCEWLSIYLVTN